MTRKELRKELFNLKLALKLIKDEQEQKKITKKIKDIQNKLKHIFFEERKEENGQYQRK